MKTSKKAGVLAVLISAVVFGLMPIIVKSILEEGGNSISTSFYRFTLALPLLYIHLKYIRKEDMGLTRDELLKLLVISIFGYGLTVLLLFMSYEYIPSGMATTLHFGYPVFVILGCSILFKDKLTRSQLISIIVCMIGLVLFYEKGQHINIKGVVLAFASSITYTFYIIFVDKSKLKEISSLKLAFYLCFIASIPTGIFAASTGNFDYTMTVKGWILSFLLSILVMYGAVGFFQYGLKTIGPQKTSILSTFEPITSILMGMMVFSETYSIRTLAGALLILIGVIITTRNGEVDNVKNVNKIPIKLKN
ncbi:MAG: EamA/RhaT family transporter [Anaerosolibacter sp.]|jgi:drug/metabolite transporter (DMT)-like permease|uniref:DMT family transporter n=1 Tax=Anaerosolibacter sp. TaxID=1872527 RepID=UPI00261490EC|nr:DMT family transporter [Anaerosolibacter sp.]MDF2546772.1 EamA/RhaT family transporter [Anaerosolibacter sp.]